MIVERLFRWSALAWSVVGLALLVIAPAVPLEGFGNHRLPAVIHAFTLGAFVNGYYALQWRIWHRLYGQDPPWPRMAILIWAVHQLGVALMLSGFLFAGLSVALLGAHYIVPAGIALHAVQAMQATRRRASGTPRHLGAHAPTWGLLIVMALGAMIILDETTGRYGMFNPPTLLVHGMSGAFLFLVPALRLAAGLDALEAGDTRADERVTAGVLLRAVPPAVGVLIVATGFTSGGRLGIPTGLGLIGGVLLWGSLPDAAAIRAQPLAALRSAWIVPAALLLFAAIRTLRGMSAAEAFALANLGAVSVLLVAGLPEMLTRLMAPANADRRHLGGAVLLVAAGAIALVGQSTGSALSIRLAAVVGFGGMLLLALARPSRMS